VGQVVGASRGHEQSHRVEVLLALGFDLPQHRLAILPLRIEQIEDANGTPFVVGSLQRDRAGCYIDGALLGA